MIHLTDPHRRRFVATSACQGVFFVSLVHTMIRERPTAVSVSTYCASLPPSEFFAFIRLLAPSGAADHGGAARELKQQGESAGRCFSAAQAYRHE